jgi:hypothetical protein
MAPAASQTRVNSLVVVEVRRTIAIVCRDKIYTSRTSKGSDQKDMMFNMYHGNVEKNYPSHVDLFLEGKGIFKAAFKSNELQINAEGNADRTSGKVLELMQILHRRDTERFIVGDNLTGNLLKLKSQNQTDEPEYVAGRTLHDNVMFIAPIQM